MENLDFIQKFRLHTKLLEAAENGDLTVFESFMKNLIDDSVSDISDFNSEDK